MYRLIFVLILTLAACAPRGTASGHIYRATSVPIYSNAVFNLARLEGPWSQVAAFQMPGQPSCSAGGAEFSSKTGARPGNLTVRYNLCLSGQTQSGAGPVVTTGPGRFTVAGASDGDWWVLWVDDGYRTMAIGNPAGTVGFILNRGPDLPKDRLQAAKQVFDFNGYDVKNLTVF